MFVRQARMLASLGSLLKCLTNSRYTHHIVRTALAWQETMLLSMYAPPARLTQLGSKVRRAQHRHSRRSVPCLHNSKFKEYMLGTVNHGCCIGHLMWYRHENQDDLIWRYHVHYRSQTGAVYVTAAAMVPITTSPRRTSSPAKVSRGRGASTRFARCAV